jgi:tryptophan synthase alpha chain
VPPAPNRIAAIFDDLRRSGRKALMPFVCGGHPAPGTTTAALPALERAGASIIEVGIPFSDPIADGPVIAAAMHAALQSGATPASVFAEVAAARPTTNLALVAMCSVSIIHRMGAGDPAPFCRRAADSGFDGLIVPDVPLEESGPIRQAADDAGLTCSLLIAPTTPPDRAAAIAAASTGFVYLLARTGITGERSDAPDIGLAVAALRRETDLPIACGFGISRPEHVRAVVQYADAAIVGSALVRRMGEAAARGQDPVAEAAAFTADLATGLR